MDDLHYMLSQIDLVALIEKDLGRPRQKSGRWVMWLCPFHQDKKTPSLAVNQEQSFWHCFGCNRNGNALSWMCEYHHMQVQEALIALGISNATEIFPGDMKHIARKLSPAAKRPVHKVSPPSPSEVWQKRGLAFLEYSQKQLWQAPKAVAYLHEKRLLEDHTIRHFQLGYNPSEIWDVPGRWGFSKEDAKQIWLPKGFVIPCFVDQELWYLKIRRVDGEPKYLHVRGSAPAMFGTDSLKGAPLILLTEGEFDCMLAWQLLRDVAGVATLGSASKKLDLERWGRYLLPAEQIIVALDNDAAGTQGAQNLAGLSAQLHPVRIPSLSPNGKDVTDYVRDGGDLWEWLIFHLEAIERADPWW